MLDALSQRMGLSVVRVTVCSIKSVVSMYNYLHFVFKDCILLRIYNEHIQFYHQRNNILLFIYLYSTDYMFQPQKGHLQVLQVSHIPLPNRNANIPISPLPNCNANIPISHAITEL
jgi:hypothetical protein